MRTGDPATDFVISRLEDTITFHLIERAQFPLNRTIYEPGGVKIPDSPLSLFDWILNEQERLHSLVGRYESPDEYPFFPDTIQKPIIQPPEYPKLLHPHGVDLNPTLKKRYIDSILPSICMKSGPADRKENYGSTAVCDVLCLQALARRIHFGILVAEVKFQQETDRFVPLIQANDRPGVGEAIMNYKVQGEVFERIRLKAKTYAADPSTSAESQPKIDVDAVAAVYEVSEILHVLAMPSS